MFVDSHCHLSFPELHGRIDAVREAMAAADVDRALVICTTLEEFDTVHALALHHDNFWSTVGVHPDNEAVEEPTVQRLLDLAGRERVVAIGETGLDYYRLPEPLDWQRERFRVHIRAARQTRKPLVVHTRNASADTLRIMGEENAADVGGVMHCFTESQEVAETALAMNFHISFSGIVTFKSARDLKEVARKVPLDRMLIETDSPYLAPTPYRGKMNQPGYVKYVAEHIAELRGINVEEVARATTANFFRLFSLAKA
jgi:TatD DNase family protein